MKLIPWNQCLTQVCRPISLIILQRAKGNGELHRATPLYRTLSLYIQSEVRVNLMNVKILLNFDLNRMGEKKVNLSKTFFLN